MPVNRTDKLSQAKFNALATLANSKTIAGKPYVFPTTGHWRTELERLRNNVFQAVSKVKFGLVDGWRGPYPARSYPLPPEAYVSGDWPIPSTNAQYQAPLYISPLSENWDKTVIVGQKIITYFATTMSARQVSYIFPSPVTPPTTNLLFRLETAGIWVKSSLLGPHSVTFKLFIQSPRDGRLRGRLALNIFTLPDSVPTVTGPSASNFTVTNNGGQIIVACDYHTSGAVEFTITDPNLNTGSIVQFVSVTNNPTDRLFFELEFTEAYQVGGIHPTQKVYRIDTETAGYLNGIGISSGADDDPASSSAFAAQTRAIYYIGNQFIASIAVSDATHGIFVGKTIPISGADFYQDVSFDPAAPALEPTRVVKAPFKPFDIKDSILGEPVRPAIFDTIPRFSVQRSTDTITDLHKDAVFLDPGTTNYQGEWVQTKQYSANDSVHYSIGSAAGYYYSLHNVNVGQRPGFDASWVKFTMARKYDQRVYYGSILRDVYVRRQPTLQGDFYLPRPADDCPPLNVEIGCIRNGAFVAFQTVTIPEGQHSIHIFPFWPVFDLWTLEGKCAKKLIYRCAEVVDIQASLMMPQPTFGTACNPPKFADYYNDTEALLNLI